MLSAARTTTHGWCAMTVRPSKTTSPDARRQTRTCRPMNLDGMGYFAVQPDDLLVELRERSHHGHRREPRPAETAHVTLDTALLVRALDPVRPTPKVPVKPCKAEEPSGQTRPTLLNGIEEFRAVKELVDIVSRRVRARVVVVSDRRDVRSASAWRSSSRRARREYRHRGAPTRRPAIARAGPDWCSRGDGTARSAKAG